MNAAAAEPDGDLDTMNAAALREVARAMRRAIRKHRDADRHALCWHHPDLWGLLPDTPPSGQVVPEWPQFLRGCILYRQSLDGQLPDAPRTDKEFEP